MPVTTININDILTPKSDGEVVTASDWNKLIALFEAINGNADQLLETNKKLDTVNANMSGIVAGSVPNESITWDKLSKTWTEITQYTQVDQSAQPFNANTTYYTFEDGQYIEAEGLTEFNSAVTYYVVETVEAGGAIATDDVIEDGAIGGLKLQDSSVPGSVCTDTFLGALLSDKITVYTDRAITQNLVTADGGRTFNHEITFDKPHKAIVILNSSTISICTDYLSATPDLHIGSGGSYDHEPFCIKILLGEKKLTDTPQSIVSGYDYLAPSDMVNFNYSCRAQLVKSYYDSSVRKLKFSIKCLRVNSEPSYYTYGTLILGL